MQTTPTTSNVLLDFSVQGRLLRTRTLSLCPQKAFHAFKTPCVLEQDGVLDDKHSLILSMIQQYYLWSLLWRLSRKPIWSPFRK